jgi:type I restriction enzyme S subunit
MNRKKIGDVVEIRRGASPRPIDDYISSSGMPWVKISDATMTNSRYIRSTKQYIKSSGVNRSVIVKPEDLIISNSATPALPRIMKIEACVHDGWLVVKNYKGIDRDFLYYAIIFYRKWLLNQGNGSIFKNLKTDILKDFEIILPAIDHQKLISHLLVSIDEKIETNNAITKELERITLLIYNFWFLQFDFPDNNGNPYKSSGGEMVYSSDLKREIPINWKSETLNNIISRIGTGLNPRNNFKLGSGNNYYVTIKNVDNGKVVLDDKCDRVDNNALRIIQKRSDLQKGDILFTSIQPVGVTYLIHDQPTNWNINESVFTLRADYSKVTSEYLFMLLSSQEMKAYTENASAGSVHKGIRHSVLKDFKFACPEKGLVEKFTSVVAPMLKQIYINDEENRELVTLRDWLLPMLVTGQVKVASNE